MDTDGHSKSDTGKASCERVLFSERQQVIDVLEQMAKPDSDVAGRERLLETVTSTLEKYLEQPHLLDPHLDAIMDIVMGKATELVLDREAEVMEASSPERAFPFQVFSCPQLHSMFRVVYQLSRVRGSKAIVRLMPHEASQLEPVIHALQAQDTDDYSTWETRYGLLLWLSMLSLVPFDIDTIDSTKLATNSDRGRAGGEPEKAGVSSPGDGVCGVVLASSAGVGAGEASVASMAGRLQGSDLVGTILSLGMKHLGDTGPTREAAAACLSSLLTRPDMEACHLRQFLEWCASVLKRVAQEGKEGQEGLSKLSFLVVGVMATLAALFKQGHREKLMDLIPVVFYPVVGLAELGLGQTLVRKMVVKLLQRLGMTYLPARVVSWRYHRGQRSLLQNLAPAPGGASPSFITEQASPSERVDAEGVAEDVTDADDVDVPAELEDVVEALLCGLRDRDTVVRWSAAKGVGRITGRLPRELADDIVCTVLDLFVESEGDGAWHGGCLALAELARRGLLLPERLPRACPVVRRALAYNVRRGATGVGTHVRDAACYVCWAFARAYSPQVLGLHLPGLCDSMLAAALLDREVNVRRAAAAAFQENVGRQGQYGDKARGSGIAHGIDIITIADYFSLGNRQQAYLDITPTVAAITRYRRHLIDYLRQDRLSHWDSEIRRLAAKALHNITPLEPAYAADVVLPMALRDSLSPDLVKRHGACQAAALVTLALGKVTHTLSPENVAGLVGVVPALEKARLYRGRGGELMRQAACSVVECLALVKVDVSVKTQKIPRFGVSYRGLAFKAVAQAKILCVKKLTAWLFNKHLVRLLDSVDESLKHPVEGVQLAAVAALKAVLKNWFPVGTEGPSKRLLTRVVSKYISGLRKGENAAITRGYALALGVLPRKIAGASRAVLEDILEALKDVSRGKHGPRSPPSNHASAQPQLNGGGTQNQQGIGAAGNSSSGISRGCGPCGDGPGGEADAETRRNALRALLNLCEEVGIGQRRPAGRGGGEGVGSGGPSSLSSAGCGGSVEEIQQSQLRRRAEHAHGGDGCVRMGQGEHAGSSEAGGGNGNGTKHPQLSARWRPETLKREDVEGVLDALLSATADYSTDNRGDVGSWCRMEALSSLERLARLAVRASTGLPLANRGDDASLSPAELLTRPGSDYERLASDGFPVVISTEYGDATVEGSRADGEVLEVSFATTSLGSHHFPYGSALMRRSELLDLNSSASRKSNGHQFVLPCLQDRISLLEQPTRMPPTLAHDHPCDRVYFSPVMIELIICAVLKQLSEKLDSVRERAGNILESLVNSQDPQLPFVPQRGALTHAIRGMGPAPLPGGEHIAGKGASWASPAFTFPIVVGLLAVPEYHDAIVAGLVVSVGGLTESVVTQSSAALLRWVRTCKSSGNKRAMAGLGMRLAGMFGEARGNDRVVVPLLKTIEVLLSNDSFEFLSANEHPLPQALLAAVTSEMKGCRDVKKTCLGASIFTNMLDFGDPVKSKALKTSVVFLAHRFPTVRKTTAEALYLKLLANEEVIDQAIYEDALEILTCTPWDSGIKTAKEARAKLGSLLNVQLPAAVNATDTGSRGRVAPRRADEMESYENLVRTAGY